MDFSKRRTRGTSSSRVTKLSTLYRTKARTIGLSLWRTERSCDGIITTRQQEEERRVKQMLQPGWHFKREGSGVWAGVLLKLSEGAARIAFHCRQYPDQAVLKLQWIAGIDRMGSLLRELSTVPTCLELVHSCYNAALALSFNMSLVLITFLDRV